MSTNFPEEPETGWISQAEAARRLGISRQAVHKLVRAGRLKHTTIGGYVLVGRDDVETYKPQAAGRPRAGDDRRFERIAALIRACDDPTRSRLLQYLREIVPPHPFEAKIGASAEVILEALQRSGELTVRMFRGVMAEAAFEADVVRQLTGWSSAPVEGSPSFDFALRDRAGEVRVQVKLQRSERGSPLVTGQKKRQLEPGMFVTETHRTRGGEDKEGAKTRPYKFGSFDLLAVSMRPSTGSWSDFMYTVESWLLPNPGDAKLMATYQPVPPRPNEDWTDDFETGVAWFRSGAKKTIKGLKGDS